MKLTIKERVVLGEILPQQGNMIEMILSSSIRKKAEFTPREITEFNLKQDGGNLTWDGSVDSDVEVFFEESEINLLKEQYKKFDEEKRVSDRMVDLFLKIRDL